MGTAYPNLEGTLALMKKILQRLPTDENSLPCLPESSKSELEARIREALSDLPQERVQNASVFSDSGYDFGNSELWNIVTVNCDLLCHLCNGLSDEPMSLVHQKNVRQLVSWTVTLGIVPNILSSVAKQVKCAVNPLILTENLTNIQKYRRLCAVTKVLVKCLKQPVVRSVVLHFLGFILAALLQLACAPLKRPCSDQSDYEASQELYKTFCDEQQHYSDLLDKLIYSIYQPQVIQELMMIQGGCRNKPPPPWLQKACSQRLTKLLLAEGGVSAMIRSTMGSAIDTGSDWKTVNVLTKIITSPKNHYRVICNQLAELLTAPNVSKSCHTVSVACINELLVKEPNIAQMIIDKILEPLTLLAKTQSEADVQSGDIIIDEKEFTLCMEQLHEYFAVKGSSYNSSCLPSHFLHPVLDVLFSLYGWIKDTMSHVCSLAAELLFRVFSDSSSPLLTEIIKTVVFKFHSSVVLSCSDISFVLGPNGGVMVRKGEDVERGVEFSAVEEAGDILVYFLDAKDSDSQLSYRVFVILLEMLLDFGIAPKNLEPSDKMLGTVEDAICEIVARSERHTGAVRLLAALAEKPEVQRRLSENPQCVATFLETLLKQEIGNISDSRGVDSSDNQDIVCVALMILEVVISRDSRQVNWDLLQNLVPLLDKIHQVAENSELRTLAGHIHNSLVSKGVAKKSPNTGARERGSCREISECEVAFTDACDPILPVRGHAIIKLTELINARNKEAVAKKDAILCLFQENMKNDDTFIYLAAINGMAAMTSFFPDTVLSSLTDEFTLAVTAGSSSPDENNLTRMKIGEVLVKAIRLLGEMASQYKSQLLNTFLVGVRDVDPLVRASSLSNLGEVCRLLGFRVGPVLQEIVICITGVISSDKAIEPRRAAAMLITLLLQGLDKDALQLFPGEALSLLRALKQLYQHDVDHVIRLHAQLALTEMDNIVRAFLAVGPTTPTIVMP